MNLDPLRIVSAEFHAGATATSQLPPPTHVEIAFAGRSNVGKSSLMNSLCARKNLVKTSSTPGCTRQVSFFETRTADGAAITLVDLPGYGYAKRSKAERGQWGELIEGYLLSRPTLRVVAALVDVRRGIEPDDLQLLELLSSPPETRRAALCPILIATKLDKVPGNQRGLRVKALQKESPIPFAAVSVELPETIASLWRRLRTLAGVGTSRPEGDPDSGEE
ncbi:MAG TPA: ribosome biogenesis GTP-binding protein YihA/YsxC [Polyangiaceae bacterium]|jgi:GTP-binding protein|nr:ribosome biogenesis GTP-binding protein YihA/YsxC [Polyangiaceae bacterium]